MRKKELLNQNMSLFEQLKKTEVEVARLTGELKKAQEQIELLSRKNENDRFAESSAHIDEPQNVKEENDIETSLEDTVCAEPVLGDAAEYGAEIIGRIVISAANCSNELTAGGNSSHRELINLILGRTEVAKSEILTAVSSDDVFSSKKAVIDKVYEQATEYFNSVMGQISGF